MVLNTACGYDYHGQYGALKSDSKCQCEDQGQESCIQVSWKSFNKDSLSSVPEISIHYVWDKEKDSSF